MNSDLIVVFQLIVLVFSVMVHEIAHGVVGLRLGDPTAKDAGRLTLNPLRHIDLFGSIILPLLLLFAGSPFLIGWAKHSQTGMATLVIFVAITSAIAWRLDRR